MIGLLFGVLIFVKFVAVVRSTSFLLVKWVIVNVHLV